MKRIHESEGKGATFKCSVCPKSFYYDNDRVIFFKQKTELLFPLAAFLFVINQVIKYWLEIQLPSEYWTPEYQIYGK